MTDSKYCSNSHTLKYLVFLIFISCGLLNLQIAVSQENAPDDTNKTLEKVIVEGQQFEKKQPLPKGKIVFSPELVSLINGNLSIPALHVYYQLVFDPVLIDDEGYLLPDPDTRRSRKTLRPILPEKYARVGSRIKRKPPRFETLLLEEGSYALTQISYRIQTSLTFILDPFDPPAVINTEIDRSLEDIRYCLSEGTLIFDVEADKTATFGKLVFNAIAKDKDKHPGHHPIAAADAPTTRPADGYIFNKDPDSASWGVGRFNALRDLCPRGNHYNVSAWPISKDWNW